jgi:hypothetical protein
MTQTAVEWLEFRYKNNINLMDYDFEQAKEMEKQHIIQSNRDGVDMVVDGKPFITGEQYYNEMFEEEVLLQSSIDGEVIWGKPKKERMYSEEDLFKILLDFVAFPHDHMESRGSIIERYLKELKNK